MVVLSLFKFGIYKPHVAFLDEFLVDIKKEKACIKYDSVKHIVGGQNYWKHINIAIQYFKGCW